MKLKDFNIALLLRYCCFLLFLGRAWQHIFWDAPYRAIFFDESLLTGPVEALFGMTWQQYATNSAVDHYVALFIKAIGCFYAACAFISLSVQKTSRFQQTVLLIGAASLFSLSFLYYIEKFNHFGQLMEYTAQWSAPIFLVLCLLKSERVNQLIIPMKIAVALTFIGHGLYAIGYYEVPGNFIDMMISVFHVDESTAVYYLKILGIMDIVVGIGIFIPRIAVPALMYAAIWGALTALARLAANFQMELLLSWIKQWFPQTLWRIPHALIPFILLCLEIQKQKR